MPYAPVAGAFAVAAIVLPLLFRLAPRVGAVAHTRGDRWHTSGTIPNLCGPGLFLAMLPWLTWQQAAVLAAFTAVGVADDVHGLTPALKAVLTAVAAAGAAWITGAAWVGVAAWVAANALNLLDHADGIAAAAAGVAFAAAGGDAAWAGLGACLGFLLYNFPPARTFMGDGGSLLLGAALVLAWEAKGPGVTAAWLAVPLLDAAFVTVRRILTGQRPWIGGRDHTGHVMLRAGVPYRLLPVIYATAALAAGVGAEAWLSRVSSGMSSPAGS